MQRENIYPKKIIYIENKKTSQNRKVFVDKNSENLFHSFLEISYQSCYDESSDKCINESSQKSNEGSEQTCTISKIKRFHETYQNCTVSPQSSSDCKEE